MNLFKTTLAAGAILAGSFSYGAAETPRSAWSQGRMALLPGMVAVAIQNEAMQCRKAQLIAKAGGGTVTCPKADDIFPIRDLRGALTRLTPQETTCIDAIHDAEPYADDAASACHIPSDKAEDVAVLINALELVDRWH